MLSSAGERGNFYGLVKKLIRSLADRWIGLGGGLLIHDKRLGGMLDGEYRVVLRERVNRVSFLYIISRQYGSGFIYLLFV